MGQILRLGLGFGLLGFLFVAADVVGQPDEERACEGERETLYAEVAERREEGPDVRLELLDRLASLRDRYLEGAPVCLGRIYEHVAFLHLMDDRYAEVAEWTARYLDGPGQQTSPRSQLLLHFQRGYALRQLGRTSEAAQARFLAASFADRAPAADGARALTAAGYMARDLGDDRTAIDYFESALRLIDDSLATNPDALRDGKGAVLTSLSIMTDNQIRRASSEAERDSLIGVLDERTTMALSVLSSEGQAAGHRAHVANLSALVAAWRGDLALARERMRSSRRLSETAGRLMPLALWNTFITEGRIAEVEGDPVAGRGGDPRAREEAIRVGEPANEAQAIEAIGALDEQEGDLDAAAAAYQAAIDRREIVRDRLGLGDWSASAFAQMQTTYRGLARVRLAQGDPEAAFAVIDRTRARYLRDLRRHLTVLETLRPEVRQAVDSLADRLSETRLALLAATSTADNARLQREVADLQQQIQDLTKAGAPDDGTALDLGALRRHLARENRTLVAYMIGDEGSTAFVVRPDTLVAVDLPATRHRVREHLRSVGPPWNGRASDPAFSLPPLHALYQDLVAPVRPWVNTTAVTIVPDTDLTSAPFAVFLTEPGDEFETARYLVHEWSITTELAAALVLAPPASTDPPVDVLAFGRSTFADLGFTWNTDQLPPLPSVEQEVESVTGHGEATVYLDRDAMERRFKEQARDARVIHLASHAEAQPELPLYSRIALTEGDGEDGTLHLYEILDAPLRADLVVLSGCSTAAGGERRGEGLMGLQYGMRAAGSAATLATMWPVADAATAELMDVFYDGLEKGLGKDEALRQAQLTYLDTHDGLSASPFFWAGPVLSGSPAPVPFQPQIPWGLGLAALAVAGGLAWRFRKTPADA